MNPKILNARRELLGVSFGQLARQIGVSKTGVWMVLHGRSTSARVLAAVDRYLNSYTRAEEAQ